MPRRAVIILLMLVLLAACAPSAAAPTPAPAPTVIQSEASGTLLLWHAWYGAERQALSRLVEQYNRGRSSGRVSLQSVPLASFAGELRAASAAGSGPHIALIPNTWLGGLAESGMVLALDGLLPEEELGALLPVTLSGARAPDADGVLRLYGLPVRFDTLALFYNTANLSAPPEDSATLLATARDLGDPSAQPPIWGLALNLSYDNTIGYLYAFGGRIFDDQGRVVLGEDGREGAERWLGWLAELQNNASVLTRVDSSIIVDRELKDGRALMTFDWAHQIGVYRSLWGERVGVAPLPRLSETGQAPRPYVRSDVLAINSRAGDSERRAAAEFLRYLISEPAQAALLQADAQPARRALALDDGTPQALAAQAFRAQAELALPMSNSAMRPLVEQEIKVMQRQVLLGLATPADVVGEADRRLRERLGE